MSGQRVIRLTVVFVWLLAAVLFALPSNHVSAAQITNRKLTLETGAGGDGGSKPGGTVKHKFDFTIPSDTTLGSIRFEYCTAASGTCTTPTGLTTTGAGVTLSNQSGEIGFVLDNTTNGAPFIHRPTAAPSSTNEALMYELSGVVNPTTANQSFYVRITTYSGEDGVTGLTDSGVVAGSTATQINLSGYMPESLIFCTGGTVSMTGGVPDCSTASSGDLTFPDFSPSATSFIFSQMSASTNADFGYSITYSGATMTSGSNTITPMDNGSGGPTTSVIGTSQFGLNLVDNATPDVGSALNPVSGGTHQGKVATNYATADSFLFKTAGDTVASSDFDGSSGPSDSQIYTVSYIVNANGAQPVGTYQTTLTYVCTATF